ncbi:MAG: substrate-binding domain-containing protein [Propionibacteriaceae bacterium]|nr:substrate-binding domain-containing protein [Propionibacteriaceae bacterium]
MAFQPDQEFHAGVVDGIYAAAEETGYEVVLSAVTPLRPEARAISTLLANRCGALLLIGSTLSAAELSREAARLPVVVIARQGRAKDVEFVCSDDEAGLVSAVRYLVGLGHRQIAYLSSYRSGSGPQRLHGYRKAMAEVGLGDLTDVVTAGSTEQSGALAAVGLLERPSLPTAVIAFNDRCLAGVHGMLLKRGVQVPQDVSLVGFDDSEIASQPQHRFTSVHQDIEWLGQTAAHNAISRIEGRDDLHRPQVVPTRLVVRESAGPPRRT